MSLTDVGDAKLRWYIWFGSFVLLFGATLVSCYSWGVLSSIPWPFITAVVLTFFLANNVHNRLRLLLFGFFVSVCILVAIWIGGKHFLWLVPKRVPLLVNAEKSWLLPLAAPFAAFAGNVIGVAVGSLVCHIRTKEANKPVFVVLVILCTVCAVLVNAVCNGTPWGHIGAKRTATAHIAAQYPSSLMAGKTLCTMPGSYIVQVRERESGLWDYIVVDEQGRIWDNYRARSERNIEIAAEEQIRTALQEQFNLPAEQIIVLAGAYHPPGVLRLTSPFEAWQITALLVELLGPYADEGHFVADVDSARSTLVELGYVCEVVFWRGLKGSERPADYFLLVDEAGEYGMPGDAVVQQYPVYRYTVADYYYMDALLGETDNYWERFIFG